MRHCSDRNMEGNIVRKIICRTWLGALSSRRWRKRFPLFYKISNNLTPKYMKDPVPQPPQTRYSLRKGCHWANPGKIEQKSLNLAFILTAHLNGIRLALKLGLHHPLLF